MPKHTFSAKSIEEIRHRELQAKSGLTIEGYCKRENISHSSWWYWRKRLPVEKNIMHALPLMLQYRFSSYRPNHSKPKNSR